MSIQSTVVLTRRAAEEEWVEKQIQKYRRTLRVDAEFMTTRSLEANLETIFFNYTIKD